MVSAGSRRAKPQEWRIKSRRRVCVGIVIHAAEKRHSHGGCQYIYDIFHSDGFRLLLLLFFHKLDRSDYAVERLVPVDPEGRFRRTGIDNSLPEVRIRTGDVID